MVFGPPQAENFGVSRCKYENFIGEIGVSTLFGEPLVSRIDARPLVKVCCLGDAYIVVKDFHYVVKQIMAESSFSCISDWARFARAFPGRGKPAARPANPQPLHPPWPAPPNP